MADVFISYKSSETTLTLVRESICPALEKAGFSCWYAKRDEKPGGFAGQIKRAIEACRVFLLILEQSALHAKHIRNETALAFRRLDDNEPITLLPFRIDNCDVKEDDDLDYYLVAEQIMDGCPPDPGHIRELVDMISKIFLAPS